MRSMAIDLAKTHGIAATALHPGWVRTEMGGPRADIDATESIAGMRNVIANLTIATAGRYWVYDGSELPWQVLVDVVFIKRKLGGIFYSSSTLGAMPN